MVRIISGTYGMRVQNRITPITSNDGPISLPADEETRLVSIGIAEYVDEPKNVQKTQGEDQDSDYAKELEQFKVEELRNMANESGIEIPKGVTRKADIIALIVAGGNTPDDDDDDAPNFNAHLPE